MSESALRTRVEILEQKVEFLQALPARVEAVELQIVQLRQDISAEFSATRQELRKEMRAVADDLRSEIRAGDEETRRLMRVLHEDVISRIKALSGNRRSRKIK